MELFEVDEKKFSGFCFFFLDSLIFACILFVAGVSHTSGQALVKEQDALGAGIKEQCCPQLRHDR